MSEVSSVLIMSTVANRLRFMNQRYLYYRMKPTENSIFTYLLTIQCQWRTDGRTAKKQNIDKAILNSCVTMLQFRNSLFQSRFQKVRQTNCRTLQFTCMGNNINLTSNIQKTRKDYLVDSNMVN